MKSASKLQHLASPILMWAIIIFGVLMLFAISSLSQSANNFFSRTIFPQSLTWPLFIPASVYWTYFFLMATRVHRDAVKSVSGITKLVTTGIYGRVRHPIYSSDIILSWGIFFFDPKVFFLIAVIWADLVLVFWMKFEEKMLIEKFDGEYEEYRKKVPMFFPKVRI